MNNVEFVSRLKQLCRDAGYQIDNIKNYVDISNSCFTGERHICTLQFSKYIYKDELISGHQTEFLLGGAL